MTSPLALSRASGFLFFLLCFLIFIRIDLILLVTKEAAELSEPNLLEGRRKDRKRGGGPRSSRNEVILQKISHMLDEKSLTGEKREEMKPLPVAMRLAPTLREEASVLTRNEL